MLAYFSPNLIAFDRYQEKTTSPASAISPSAAIVNRLHVGKILHDFVFVLSSKLNCIYKVVPLSTCGVVLRAKITCRVNVGIL